MGDREAQLRRALDAIGRFPQTELLRVSPIYESEPWGPVEQADFLNLLAEIRTGLQPEELLRLCKETERAQGRTEGVRWGPRPVDIDILLYDDMTVKTEDLQIPHARMWERAFVLKPLADLRPNLSDPAGRPIISLLEDPEIVSQGVWRHTHSGNEPGSEEHG